MILAKMGDPRSRTKLLQSHSIALQISSNAKPSVYHKEVTKHAIGIVCQHTENSKMAVATRHYVHKHVI